MTRTTAGRSLLTLLALALALGCTPPREEAGTEGAEPLRAVQRATAKAGSARIESTTVVGRELSLDATGTLGWRDGLTGTLTLTYTGGTTAETLKKLGTTSMEARYLPDAYYARMGDAFAGQVGGRHWIRYAYDDLADLGGDAGAGLAEQLRGSSPDQAVKLLLASDDVREVGTETTRGRRTTHWSGTVDGTADGQTVDIWVDEHDLLVKKTERGRTATGELSQTAYYTDYGTPAPAERPPAADTADFGELLAKNAQEGSNLLG
ncbi:hypothetical protein [Streptomyces sp. NPDC003717]|uniref:hypothetical protein n=1 Tax=Streptomyces sp. NPDC003717 TaxID=3154276 RepID=UPI0033BF32CD